MEARCGVGRLGVRAVAGVHRAQECSLVRAAAEAILARDEDAHESWERGYRQMARGTLAALDWVEGRRLLTPSSREPRQPDDVIIGRYGGRRTALILEILDTGDWGSGHVPAPNEDMHYHGGVWALLCWWQGRNSHLAITVPGLDVPLNQP